MTIKRNMARCKRCNTIIESKHVHSFVQCKCGACFVDGGLDYLRRGADTWDNFEELSVEDDGK